MEEPEQTTKVTVDRPLDPSAIMQLATGYWASATLLAANDLQLFGVLKDGAKTATEVAHALGTEARATEMLLDACCGLNLVAKQGAQYMLPSISAAYLVAGEPNYLGNALRWARDQYQAWGRLAEAARTGEPVMPPHHLGDDPGRTRTFVLGMHDRAMGVARGVIRFLDLEGRTSLLDVGGGPGTYSMLLAREYPDLHATVLDLPGVVEVAQELIAGAGLSDRVEVMEADATFGDYGEDRYDAVLFSGVLHQMSVETIQRMLAGAYRALVAGGKVLVSDMMLDATHTQPVFSALFSLQMLLTSRQGGVFSAEECMAWLQEAGFGDVEVHRLPRRCRIRSFQAGNSKTTMDDRPWSMSMVLSKRT
jgi:ubiquinone/menaquinone biosynthesis C-methylase UbiE